jgi:hypothetical protein
LEFLRGGGRRSPRPGPLGSGPANPIESFAINPLRAPTAHGFGTSRSFLFHLGAPQLRTNQATYVAVVKVVLRYTMNLAVAGTTARTQRPERFAVRTANTRLPEVTPVR